MMSDLAAADNSSDEEFERKKVIFEQDCQEFRSLNGFLWQIPIIVSTLTGGLWFGATKVGDNLFVQSSLFLLASVSNICFVVVLWRLRKGVMEPLLEHITNFQGRPRNAGKYTMIWMFTILLALSSVLSFTAFLIMLFPKICGLLHATT